MTVFDPRAELRQQLSAAALPLYEGASLGLAKAKVACASFPESDYRWLLSMHARAAMRLFWQKEMPRHGWAVAGQANLMGQTMLVSPDGRFSLRLMKENGRVYPGGVPVAGHSASRRAAWQEALFDDSVWRAAESKMRADCLLLWDYTIVTEDPVVTLRVVHTTGEGEYGVPVPIDFSFEIDSGGELFESIGGFEGSPELEEFFPVLIEEENRGEGLGS